MSSITLPAYSEKRVVASLAQAQQVLFRALDEIQEYGGNHVLVLLTDPVTKRQMKVMLCTADVEIAREHA